MRKLKKALSLFLALAMMLSLCVTGFAATSAETYSDADEIGDAVVDALSEETEDAIDILTQLGYVEGYDTGDFQADTEYTREQAAKIITYILAGADGGDAVGDTESSTGYTDVASTRWSSGYVAYATAKGVIVGYGDGTYGPEDTLTAAQWIKMLDVAILGVSAASVEGDGWDTVAVEYAVNAGLLTYAEYNTILADGFNRGYACLLAVRAMLLSDDQGVSSLGGLTTSISYSVLGAPISVTYTRTGSSAAVSYVETASISAIGDTSYDYDGDIAEISDGAFDNVDGLTLAAVKAAVDKDGTYTVYVDGVVTESATTIGGLGTYVKVYQTGAAEYVVVVANTYSYVITAEDKTESEESAKGNFTMTISSTLSVEVPYDGHDIGDVLIYFIDVDGKVVLDAVESNITSTVKTNALTAATASAGFLSYATGDYSANITGETYVKLGVEEDDEDVDPSYFSKNYNTNSVVMQMDGHYAYYTDAFGNLIYVAQYVADTVSDVGYVYVLQGSMYYAFSSEVDLENDIDAYYYEDVLIIELDVIYVDDSTTSVTENVRVAVTQADDGTWYLIDECGYADKAKTSGDATLSILNQIASGLSSTNATSYITVSGEEIAVSYGSTASVAINMFYEYYTYGDEIIIGENVTSYSISESGATVTYTPYNGSKTTGVAYSGVEVTKIVTTSYDNEITSVSVSSSTGYSNLSSTIGIVLTSESGLISKIVTLTENNTGTIYGMYLGQVGSSSTYGTQYAFALSDGSVYTGYVDAGTPSFKVGTVYTLTTSVVNSENIFEAAETSYVSGYLYTLDADTTITLVDVDSTTYVNGKPVKVYSTSGFGGVAYSTTEVEEVSSFSDITTTAIQEDYICNAKEGSYVYLYTNSAGAVVFVTVGHNYGDDTYVLAETNSLTLGEDTVSYEYDMSANATTTDDTTAIVAGTTYKVSWYADSKDINGEYSVAYKVASAGTDFDGLEITFGSTFVYNGKVYTGIFDTKTEISTVTAVYGYAAGSSTETASITESVASYTILGYRVIDATGDDYDYSSYTDYNYLIVADVSITTSAGNTDTVTIRVAKAGTNAGTISFTSAYDDGSLAVTDSTTGETVSTSGYTPSITSTFVYIDSHQRSIQSGDSVLYVTDGLNVVFIFDMGQ